MWVLVERMDMQKDGGGYGETGGVEKVKARDLNLAGWERWDRDMQRLEQREEGGDVVVDEGEGGDGDKEYEGGESDDDESLETEEEYWEVLREFRLE